MTRDEAEEAAAPVRAPRQVDVDGLSRAVARVTPCSCSAQRERAEAAEAKVARVEALCESANLRLDEPRLWASEVRAALAGPEGAGSADE